MSTLTFVGLTLAFLGPVPPMRRESPDPRPELPGSAWAATLIMVSLCVITIVPMITIWSFHRPLAAARARCEAEGGQWAPTTFDGSYRCKPAAQETQR